MVELTLREPGAPVWPTLLKRVLPAVERIVDKLQFSELVASGMEARAEMPHQAIGALRDAECELLRACAAALRSRPLESLMGSLTPVADETDPLLEDLQSRAEEVRALAESVCTTGDVRCAMGEAPLADATVALSDAAVKLAHVQETSSMKGLALTLAGFLLPAMLTTLEIVKFWVLLPKNVATAQWTGELAWWLDYRLHATIRALVTFPSVLAVVAFVPDVRNYLNTPLGPLPYGALGQWLCLPVALCLLHTVDGALGKGVLRIFGTAFGALLGYAAGAALIDVDITFGCFIFCLVNFVAAFVGADASGRFGGAGVFNARWGYAAMLSTYTAMILGIESKELQERYSLEDFVTIRIVGQLVGIAVAVGVTMLIAPRFARPTICGLAAGAIREMGKALVQTAASPPPPPKHVTDPAKWVKAARLKASARISEVIERIKPLLPESIMLLEPPPNDPTLAVLCLLKQLKVCTSVYLEEEAEIKEAETAAACAAAELLSWVASRVNHMPVRGRSMFAWTHKITGAAPADANQGESLLLALSAATSAAFKKSDEKTASSQSMPLKAAAALIALHEAVRLALPTLTNTPVVGQAAATGSMHHSAGVEEADV